VRPEGNPAQGVDLPYQEIRPLVSGRQCGDIPREQVHRRPLLDLLRQLAGGAEVEALLLIPVCPSNRLPISRKAGPRSAAAETVSVTGSVLPETGPLLQPVRTMQAARKHKRKPSFSDLL
jgi:hypothetical protein